MQFFFSRLESFFVLGWNENEQQIPLLIFHIHKINFEYECEIVIFHIHTKQNKKGDEINFCVEDVEDVEEEMIIMTKMAKEAFH